MVYLSALVSVIYVNANGNGNIR